VLRFALVSLVLSGCVQRPSEEAASTQLARFLSDMRAASDAEAAGLAEAHVGAMIAQSGSPTIDVLLARADALAQSDTPERATPVFDRVIELAPEHADGWARRAAFRYEQGDLSAAFADLSRCLTLEPSHLTAWMGAGLILEDWGEDEKALKAYREALALSPSSPEAQRAARRVEARLQGLLM
jgi:Flp pilus assembly protein TadD